MSTNSISITPDERTARNRANAAHSTGPKTEAGKQHSCLNALRHGLTGHTIILPKEDLDAYHDFTDKFFAEFKPRKATGAIPRRHILATEPHPRARK